jgi:hypothetical protein
MSTSEEVRELPPDPVEIVDDFEQSHHQMVEHALAAYASPSSEILEQVTELLKSCQEKIEPFKATMFFKESGNEVHMSLALKAVIDAVQEMAVDVRGMNPEHEELRPFMPGVQPYIAYCISRDDSIEVAPEFLQFEEGQSLPTPERATETACNIYLGMLNEFELALMNSDNVSKYLYDLKHSLEQTKKRGEMLKLYGGVAAAAFAGTELAHTAPQVLNFLGL